MTTKYGGGRMGEPNEDGFEREKKKNKGVVVSYKTA